MNGAVLKGGALVIGYSVFIALADAITKRVAEGFAFLGTGTRMSPLRLLRAHDTCTGASKPGTKRL